MRAPSWLLAPVLAAALAAAPAASPAPAVLTVETFNAGLAEGYVDHAARRAGPVARALADGESDVVCLQEVWRDSQRRDVARALAGTFPHSFHSGAGQEGAGEAPSCRYGDLFGEGRPVTCLRARCGGVPEGRLSRCMMDRCGGAFRALGRGSPACARALFAKTGWSPVLAVLSLLNPLFPSGAFAHGGSDGLLLLSKLPLEGTGVVEMGGLSTVVRRNALKASVRVGGRDVDLLCAHLASPLDIPYVGRHSSWEGEHEAQAAALLAAARGLGPRAALMGDLNCEPPGADGAGGRFPRGCSLLAAPFQGSGEGGPCTFCSGNPLVAPGGADARIDHVWSRGLARLGSERTRTKPLVLTVSGKAVETRLSDHYGVRVRLGLGPAPAPDPAPKKPTPK